MSDKYQELCDRIESGDIKNVRMIENSQVNVFDSDGVYSEKNSLELSEKEKLFCLNYVYNGMNIYQAAVSAGYKESYAKSSSYKLMEKVGIKEYISELFSEVEKTMTSDIVMSKLELMKFWTDISRGKLKNPHSIPQKAEEAMEQLSFFQQDKNGGDVFYVPEECKIPLSQRLKASENIAKYYGMIDDMKQINQHNVVVKEDLSQLSDEELKNLIASRIGAGCDG